MDDRCNLCISKSIKGRKLMAKKRAKKVNNTPLESWEQEQVINWKKNNILKYPCLKYMSGSISGIKMSQGARAKMVKQGFISGVPDIDLPAKNKFFSGLHIELKRQKGGVLSDAQEETLQFLADQGRSCHVCKGHRAAISVLLEYLENI